MKPEVSPTVKSEGKSSTDYPYSCHEQKIQTLPQSTLRFEDSLEVLAELPESCCTPRCLMGKDTDPKIKAHEGCTGQSLGVFQTQSFFYP